MTFTTETDLVALDYLPARQPDSKLFRNWEVAGTAHADSYTLVVGRGDSGELRATSRCSTPCQPAERDLQRHHQMRFAVQHRADDLRAAARPSTRSTPGSSTAPRGEGTSPGHERRRSGTVRTRREPAREGGIRTAARRCAGRDALGPRSRRAELLRTLRTTTAPQATFSGKYPRAADRCEERVRRRPTVD